MADTMGGKIVIITGASSGIGEATALALAQRAAIAYALEQPGACLGERGACEADAPAEVAKR